MIVYLDGFHLKVRMAKRVISVPVLVALGVAPDGQKRLLSLRRGCPAAVEFGRVAAAPVNTLRQQPHRCQEISVCF